MSPCNTREYEDKRSVPWKVFGCSEDPFRAAIDERFIYLSGKQQKRFARLLRRVEEREGLSLVSGPAGSGKTTLLRKLVAELRASDSLIFSFSAPFLTIDVLLDRCREQAGMSEDDNALDADPFVAVRELLSGLDSERRRVLLIDEAQSLPEELLNGLLALARPGSDGKSLIPIVLAGKHSIIQRLIDKPHHNWAHSTCCLCEAIPLQKREVAAFIRHRLSVASCASTNPFSHKVIKRIADYANGVPGTINTLCRLALFFASDGEEPHVSAGSVELAASAALLNKEPLKGSLMGFAKHLQSERGVDQKEAPAGNGATITDMSAAKSWKRFLSKNTPAWSSFRSSFALPPKVHGLLSAFRRVLQAKKNSAQWNSFFSGNRSTASNALDRVDPLPVVAQEPSVGKGSLKGTLAAVDANSVQTLLHRPVLVLSATAISALLALGTLIPFYPEAPQGPSAVTALAVTQEDAKRTIGANKSTDYEKPDPQVMAVAAAQEVDAAAVATAPSNPDCALPLKAREQVGQAPSLEMLRKTSLLPAHESLCGPRALGLGNLDEAVELSQQGLAPAPSHSAPAGLSWAARKQEGDAEQERKEVDRPPEQPARQRLEAAIDESPVFTKQGVGLTPENADLDRPSSESEEAQAEERERRQKAQDLLQLAQKQHDSGKLAEALSLVEQSLRLVLSDSAPATLETEVQVAPVPKGPESVSGELVAGKSLDTKAEITALLAECEAHYRANRLTSGKGGTALDCYRNVLELEPANALALEGITRIADRYAEWAVAKIEQRRPSLAHHYLDKLASVDPRYPQLQEVRERLEELQRSKTRSRRAPKRRRSTTGRPVEKPKPKAVATVAPSMAWEGEAKPRKPPSPPRPRLVFGTF